MGNNRGTKYSAVNRNISDKTDPEYWDYDWGCMGLYDTPAFINKIVEITDQPKVTHIGYEQGNTQVLYGLAKEKDYSRKLNKIIALAPCLYQKVQGLVTPYEDGIGGFRSRGIYGVNGPNWADDKDLINTDLPEMKEKVKAWTRNGQVTSVKALEWTYQVSQQKKLQQYKEDYVNGDVTEAAGDLGIIEVPIWLFIADEDQVCTKYLLEEQLPEEAVKYTHVFPRADHDYFVWQNQMDFMKVLKTQITSDGAFEAMFATFSLTLAAAVSF